MMNERGIDNAKLARSIGVSPTAVGNYVAGRVPRAEILARIAEFFEITTDQLLLGETLRAMKNDFESAAAEAAEKARTVREEQIIFEAQARINALTRRAEAAEKETREFIARLRALLDEFERELKK